MSRLKGKMSAGKMRGAVVIREGSGSGSSTWGNILGDINNQTDLKNALNAKQNTITDLATIRSNAEAGKMAHDNLPTKVNKSDYPFIIDNNTVCMEV